MLGPTVGVLYLATPSESNTLFADHEQFPLRAFMINERPFAPRRGNVAENYQGTRTEGM